MNRFLFFVVIPMLAVLVSIPVLSALDCDRAANAAGLVGTLGVLGANLVYIVFWDSRKVWPKASAGKRASNVLTFKRHDPR